MRYTYIKLLIHSEVLNKELFRTASFSTGSGMSLDDLAIVLQYQKNGTGASKESTNLTMLPLAALVSSAGQRKGKTFEAAEHFMIVFWLLIKDKVQFFYSDAIKRQACDRVKLLLPGCSELSWKCYPQVLFEMRWDMVQFTKRRYDFDVADILKWLQTLQYDRDVCNTCPLDTSIMALLSIRHSATLGRSGVLVIPGDEGAARNEA